MNNSTIITNLNMMFVMLIILLRSMIDRHLQRKEMHYYVPMVITDICLLVSHLIQSIFVGQGFDQNVWNMKMIHISSTFMHAFYYLLLFFFVKYTLAYLRQYIYISKWCEYVTAGIGILYTILWSINNVNHMFVYLTEEGIVHGPYYAWSQVGGYVILAIIVSAIVYGYKAIGPKAFFTLLSFVVFPLIQSILRHYLPLPTSLEISLSLSLIMIYSFIHVEQVRHFSNITNVLELSKRNIYNLEQLVGTFRKERHDLRFHLTALSGLLENGDIQGAQEYLDQYVDSLASPVRQYCHNAPLNAVLEHYVEKCEEQKIPVDISVDLEDEFFIDEIDFCVLIGNLFENAYEASLNMPDMAEIKVRIRQTSDHIIAMKICNRYDGKLMKEGNQFLSTKREDGGVGLDSVREIAARYNAKVDIETEDNLFEVKMILTD